MAKRSKGKMLSIFQHWGNLIKMLFRFHFAKNAHQDKTNKIHAVEDIDKMESFLLAVNVNEFS